MSDLHVLTIKLDDSAQLGTGRGGEGFNTSSHRYVPGSTLRGALSAAWWARRNPAETNTGDQADFDDLIAGLSIADAVVDTDDQSLPRADLAMDQRRCKYSCTPGQVLVWTTTTCPECDNVTALGKGQRALPDARITAVTRSELNVDETSKDENLFRREALQAPNVPLKALISGDIKRLVAPETVIRVGGGATVNGRAKVTSVEPLSSPPVEIVTNTAMLRLELLTACCFVDDFGRPVTSPQRVDFDTSFGQIDSANYRVVQEFTRMSVAQGFHRMANCPKPQDISVLQHSVYYVEVTGAAGKSVPSVVSTLGIRTSEGCGWARVDLATDEQTKSCVTDRGDRRAQ